MRLLGLGRNRVSQIIILWIDLCLYIFRIKDIRIITLNSKVKVISLNISRDIIGVLKLQLNKDIIILKGNYLPCKVQLRNIKTIF